MWAQALGALAGSVLDFVGNKNNADKNIKLQKQFAQQGIQWKVADAKQAGIHPLAALGAQTTSFSPVQVGSNFAQAGQDIGRAMQGTQNENTKTASTLAKLQLQRAELENTLLASQIKRYNQAGTPPSSPVAQQHIIPGQGSAPAIKVEPQEMETALNNAPHTTPGVPPSVTFVKAPKGYSIMPSKNAKELMEDNFILEQAWNAKNLVIDPPRPNLPERDRMWYDRMGTWRYPRYRRHPKGSYGRELINHPARTGGPYR